MKTPEEKLAWNEYMRQYRKTWSPEMRERVAAMKRRWLEKNPEKHRASSRRASKKRRIILLANPEIDRGYRIKHSHNLTLETYDARLKMQNNMCRLCSLPFIEGDGPVLDHNHDTNQLRDFIHRTCNLAIGNLKEDPAICRKAAEYLERHGLEEG